MVLPLVKLGSLAFRTLSKPIAARLKHNAGIHPKFRGFIIGLAQANHRFTTNMERRLYGRATDIHIRPLNEEKAIQAAADFLGELFVFSVAGAAIIYEVQRGARAEARKEEIRRQEIEARKKRIEELANEVQMMKQTIMEIERRQCERRDVPSFRPGAAGGGGGTAWYEASPTHGCCCLASPLVLSIVWLSCPTFPKE